MAAASSGSAGFTTTKNETMTEEEVMASEHYPILSELTNDFVLLEKWCRGLKDYKYIDPNSEEDDGGLEEKEFIRYIDMRKIPLKLSPAVKVTSFTDDNICVKTIMVKPLFWTIIRRFCVVFQKRNFRDKLLAAVVNLENKYNITE